VVAILDWELTTLGSPFSDLANLTMPFALPWEIVGGSGDGGRRIRELSPLMRAFGGAEEGSGREGPCSLGDLEGVWKAVVGFGGIEDEMKFARSFTFFRVSVTPSLRLS
jgi:aminoglycoside phosphotransferase (APT) family kinase protein